MKLNSDVEMDLKFVLERNLKGIIRKYGAYIDCLRALLEEKGVSPVALRSYLLSVTAFSNKYDGQRLALISDKKNKLENAETITDIFIFLTTECASFLNYDIFQDILEKYKINEDQKELKYPEHIQDYIEKHKVSEFVKINPLLKSKNSFEKLTLKYDVEYTCRLAKVKELKNSIAEIMDLNPSALHIVDIKEGCIVVTFLIPASVADSIFTPDTVFTSEQEAELRAASVKWLKCKGYTFFFGKGTTETQGNIT